MKLIKRKVKRILYCAQMCIFNSEYVLRNGYKPKKKPYTPESKYARILNTPYRERPDFAHNFYQVTAVFSVILLYILYRIA